MSKNAKHIDPLAEVENITNWIRNYFVENGPNSKAVIGISGGKDSTVAAGLLVRALGPDRVVGVLMPQDVQTDIDDSREICDYLGIQSIEIDIGPACTALYGSIDEELGIDSESNAAIKTNAPARIRMTTLYAIAALCGGRVCCTENASEAYVGYSTKYGDLAGDFAPLREYYVREIYQIGDALDLPMLLVHKAPADGMSGKTDEDNMGFTYEELDAYLLDGTPIEDFDTFVNIETRHKRNLHKTRVINLPCARPQRYYADGESDDYYF